MGRYALALQALVICMALTAGGGYATLWAQGRSDTSRTDTGRTAATATADTAADAAAPQRGRGRLGIAGPSLPRGGQEPAFARGYADGVEQGRGDARRRDRYDPVGSRSYRDGERGYYAAYGTRDAYKTNYRNGFRQGYEDGYRGRPGSR